MYLTTITDPITLKKATSEYSIKTAFFGYADSLGNVVIKPQFTFAYPFEDGKAKVTNSGKKVKAGLAETTIGLGRRTIGFLSLQKEIKQLINNGL